MLHLPTHILYYEDYATNLNRTVSDLAQFLRLPTTTLKEQQPLFFQAGKTYEYLFTPLELKIAARLIRAWATVDCWGHVRNYVSRWSLSLDDIRPSSLVDTDVTHSVNKRVADPHE
jgi:hypothetical protein